MSISSMLLSLLLFISFSLSPPLFSSANSNSITIPLSRAFTNKNNNPWENLKNQAAAASLERAQHLKLYPNVIEQLTPHKYGGHSVSLSFGTPKQTLRFMMDTARSLSWFPCTHNYTCANCNFSGVDPAHIPTFIPKSSSSYKPLAGASPQCEWLFSSSSSSSDPCNKISCAYAFQHEGGGGNIVKTAGLLASETLTLLPGGGLSVPNFIVGCSLSSAYMPEGVVGFGRGPVSLPAQMGLKRFSYCMVTHNFDDETSSDLALTSNTTEGGRWRGEIEYTPFAKNPNVSSHPELLEYYYVELQNIFVDGVDVKVPAKYLLAPDAEGHGGTILDSTTSYTHMEKPVHDLVFNEFQKKVSKKYKRDKSYEKQTGLGLCYNVSRAGHKDFELPQLTLRFVGGAEMVLPLMNYVMFVDKHYTVVCITIVNGGGEDGKVGLGPSIILGNRLQQQHFYMEYDLENNRLGIRQQICSV